MKIAIIKADDMNAKSDNWLRFFQLSKEKGVKVSIGVITDSLALSAESDYRDWLIELANSTWIEFWNHGWSHNKWTEQGETCYEFFGSGYDLQKANMNMAQESMKTLFGDEPEVFGAPYNKIDADTVKVLNETPRLRLLFGYRTPSGLVNKNMALMPLRGEHYGVGQPNYQAFVEAYHQTEAIPFTALQFHPDAFSDTHFAQYSQILDFLTREGWTFMLPSEYLQHLDAQA